MTSSCCVAGCTAATTNQTLLEAIGNPRREAHDARQQAEHEACEREYKQQLRRAAQQQRAEREARRPVCTSCGTRFTDARWKAIEPAGWDAPREAHPHLCDDCKQRAITAERQAEQATHEHQEHDQAVPEQKTGGTWTSRPSPSRAVRPARDPTPRNPVP
ncbi:hypothetical protein ACIRG4_34585 [Streptomyces sp. NPDC102395]|uniref:hypothetical protein n=1 Tax=Streptomyces sp. NPDC102395 TaxID=3366168 RepID=UPI0038110B7E